MINSISGIDNELLYSYVTQNNNIGNSVINNISEKIQQEATDEASEVNDTTQNSDETDASTQNGETDATEEEPISKQRQNAQKIIKIFMSDATFSAKYKSAMAKFGVTTNEDGSIDKTSLLESVKKTIEDTLNNSSFSKKYNNFMKKMTGEDASTDTEDTQDDENDITSSNNIQATIQKYKELLSNSKYSDVFQDKVNELKNNTNTSENITSESLKDYMETNIVDVSDIKSNSQFSYLGDEVLSLQDELKSHVNSADSVKTYDDVEEYIDYYTNLYNQIVDKKAEYDKEVKTNS